MPPRAFAGPLGVNQGEGIPPPRDLITSDTPPGTPRDDDDDITVASVCNIGMRGNKKAMAGAVQVMDKSMTPEQPTSAISSEARAACGNTNVQITMAGCL